jgi:hypothetical protein
MNRWEIEQKIVIRALKDPAFKKKLLAQPREAVLEFLKGEKGANLAALDKVNIRVVEEKKQEWVLAMPYLKASGEALTDEMTERLHAGGGTLGDTSILCIQC